LISFSASLRHNLRVNRFIEPAEIEGWQLSIVSVLDVLDITLSQSSQVNKSVVSSLGLLKHIQVHPITDNSNCLLSNILKISSRWSWVNSYDFSFANLTHIHWILLRSAIVLECIFSHWNVCGWLYLFPSRICGSWYFAINCCRVQFLVFPCFIKLWCRLHLNQSQSCSYHIVDILLPESCMNFIQIRRSWYFDQLHV